MKLKKALSSHPLNAGQVVAGKDSVERDISWVQVVDHPDIESWVKEGHLLLSTGYNWPKTEAAAASIVEKLASKGISGVVLAVPHFLDHFPVASVEAAERVGLPLIELPWDVPFSEITQAVHRELVDQQSLALERSEQIHRELTEAAVSGNSLRDVAEVLGRVLGHSVHIYSVDGNVLGAFTPPALQPPSPRAPPPSGFRALVEAGLIGQIDSAHHPVRLQLGPDSKTRIRLIAYAARVRADRVGYVIVTEEKEPLSTLDLRAIEHAGTVAALQISHQRELSMQEARLGYALVASLIEGRFEEKPQTLERAKLSGWDNEACYRLCTVLLDEPNPLSRQGFARREEFAARASTSLTHRGIHPLISLSANQIQILVPEGLNIEAWWAEFLPTRMAMGVSQAKAGAEGMRVAGQETSELIEHLKPGRVHYFEQMLFPRVLNGDPEAKRIFLAQLFDPLEENKRGRHLLETALALAEEGFHLQRTAERLNVHLSTLRYRLGRLSELTGLDLESTEGRFRLQVGARLYLMNESK